MMHLHSLKTVIGGLSLLLVLSACSSGSKQRTTDSSSQPSDQSRTAVSSPQPSDKPRRPQPADMPRSDVVTDRGTTPSIPYDPRYDTSDQPRLSDRSPEIASACPSKVDAQGNRVFDDPSCPDRYRSQIGTTSEKDVAGLAAACPSKVDATGKTVYDDPACPDRYRGQMGHKDNRARLAADCLSRTDAKGKLVYDDPTCAARNRYTRQENAFYDRYADKAVKHARAAEIAASRGNLPDMLQDAEISLDHAKEARRAGNNADLAAGIAALRQTIASGQGNELSGATSSIREARIDLSRAAGIKPLDDLPAARVTPVTRAHTVRGELARSTKPTTGISGGEQYVVRDPQNREVPIALSPEMSQQVREGDMVEAQIDSAGHVTSITKAQ